MPTVNIQLFEGRTLEQKRKLAEKLTGAVIEVLNVPSEAVRVTITEMSRENLAVGGVLNIDKGK
ncbi:hypothetical protein MASR2M79_20240 [Aminivibrio sp.]